MTARTLRTVCTSGLDNSSLSLSFSREGCSFTLIAFRYHLHFFASFLANFSFSWERNSSLFSFSFTRNLLVLSQINIFFLTLTFDCFSSSMSTEEQGCRLTNRNRDGKWTAGVCGCIEVKKLRMNVLLHPLLSLFNTILYFRNYCLSLLILFYTCLTFSCWANLK